MGLLATDIVPTAVNGPSAITPAPKEHKLKVIQVARTDTVASTKAILPANFSVYNVYIYRSVASDAGITASVTVNIIKDGSTVSTGSYDVKGGGAATAIVQMTNLPLVQPVPMGGDIIIQAVYAETGGASTTGGPWKIAIDAVQ